MGQIVTLTNEFCKSFFVIERSLSKDEIKEMKLNENDNKYVTADVKAIHWKMFFLEVAKINSFDINGLLEGHTYTKPELLKALGIKKKYGLRELHKELEVISKIEFRFEDEKKIDTFTMMKRIQTNFEDGTITLTANDELKKFLLIGDVRKGGCVEGFTQFNRDVLMSFKSAYAIRLYLYLATFKNLSTTSVSIENLYKLLNVHGDYARKDLWRNIIIKACKEISEKTELNVIPVAKKRATGKEMTSVMFTIQSNAVIKKELNIDLFVKSFIERQSLKIATPEVKRQIDSHVNTIKTTFDAVYDSTIDESDIYKAIGYCGGDIKMAAKLFGEAIKEKAGSKVGYVRAKAKKENIIPLKMFK